MKISRFLVPAFCIFLMHAPTSGFSQTSQPLSTPGSQQPATPQVQVQPATPQVQVQPAPGPANSDIIISDKVQDAIKNAAPKDATGVNVNVEVKKGIVILTGVVADKQAKDKAGQIVRNVPGVKGVINKLETNK